MNQAQPIKFSLKSPSIPVVLEGEGGPVEYEIREITAAKRDEYLDKLASRMRLDTTGKPAGIKKFDGLQAELLALCLFKKEGETPVAHGDIQKWPASVVNKLYKEAQNLNSLSEEKEEEPKKD